MSAEQPKTPVTDDVTAPDISTDGTTDTSTVTATPTTGDTGTVTPNNSHAEGTKA
ncbi:hypothetical protein [Streptomyces sp. NPDC020983]|uniref:hypothetical protein n=1 Tax=Streptomyces sp. NPDC020983 TaxID=3365106 RepID=UPI0037A87107